MSDKDDVMAETMLKTRTYINPDAKNKFNWQFVTNRDVIIKWYGVLQYYSMFVHLLGYANHEISTTLYQRYHHQNCE